MIDREQLSVEGQGVSRVCYSLSKYREIYSVRVHGVTLCQSIRSYSLSRCMELFSVMIHEIALCPDTARRVG